MPRQVRRCIYVCIAGAKKPLNVLSKFKKHFVIETVCFQAQLEAGGYFSDRFRLLFQPTFIPFTPCPQGIQKWYYNRKAFSISYRYLFSVFHRLFFYDTLVLAQYDICNSSSYVINSSRPYGLNLLLLSYAVGVTRSNYSKRMFFFYRFNATALFFHKHSLWFSL